MHNNDTIMGNPIKTIGILFLLFVGIIMLYLVGHVYIDYVSPPEIIKEEEIIEYTYNIVKSNVQQETQGEGSGDFFLGIGSYNMSVTTDDYFKFYYKDSAGIIRNEKIENNFEIKEDESVDSPKLIRYHTKTTTKKAALPIFDAGDEDGTMIVVEESPYHKYRLLVPVGFLDNEDINL